MSLIDKHTKKVHETHRSEAFVAQKTVQYELVEPIVAFHIESYHHLLGVVPVLEMHASVFFSFANDIRIAQSSDL